MATNDDVKTEEFSLRKEKAETALVNETEYVRDDEGTWRYAESWVKVPGGRDVTLTERFNPKFVIAPTGDGSRIERVVISGEDIGEHPDLLGWCLELGFPVKGPADEVLEVMVPFEVWQDRDRIPGEVYVPEHHGTEAERELAEAERKYREADSALEAAAAKRAEVLRRHSEDMTRNQARLITNLSVGRIQQLIREGAEVDGYDLMLLAIVENQRPKNLTTFYDLAKESLEISRVDPRLKRRIQSLRDKGLIERRSSRFRLTPEGKEAFLTSRPDLRDLASGAE